MVCAVKRAASSRERVSGEMRSEMSRKPILNPIALLMALVSVVASPGIDRSGVGCRRPAHRHEGAAARNLHDRAGLRLLAGGAAARGRPVRNDHHHRPGTRRSPPRRSRTRWPAAPRRPSTRRSSCRSGSCPCARNRCASTLSPSEWTAIEEYEQTFNVRQLTGRHLPRRHLRPERPDEVRRIGRHPGNAHDRRQNDLPLPEGDR